MKLNLWLFNLGVLSILVGCRTQANVVSQVVLPEVGPTPVQENQEPVAPTDNYGPAPEILNDVWLNTDAPLRIANQRGKVVLVEFWTFG